MKIIALIPGRLDSSRFPNKLLQDLGGAPVIVRTYQATCDTKLFDQVIVVTDSLEIKKVIENIGGSVIMSLKKHESGSDRIAEAAMALDVDIIVNVQGDEPLIDAESLQKVIELFQNDHEQEIDLASLMVRLDHWEEVKNPNHVKVIVDSDNFAMYFSRSPIPYPRDKDVSTTYYKHKGVYAFRKKALIDFTTFPLGKLEAVEKIEAIRFLEYKRKIKMVETSVSGVEIDTPEDLEKARAIWK